MGVKYTLDIGYKIEKLENNSPKLDTHRIKIDVFVQLTYLLVQYYCHILHFTWYGIGLFIVHGQHNVICNSIPILLPMKGKHHVTRRLSYHNNCYVKHNIFIITQSTPLR